MRLSFCRSFVLALGLMAPLYYTYKSLEDKEAQQKSVCLKYWIGVASYTVIDGVAGQLGRGPLKELVDCVRLITLVWIQVKPPETFYDQFVGPMLEKWKPHILEFIDSFSTSRMKK
ncbi:receptor expression-enhancing protein 3-like [Rhipicephalus microplus]|uniref:receptor expression-enhancing protein 3-like n=1 Tax=Rhipicephalus microplus TaxID=6941 RepID=UPI003F6D4744